MTKQALTATTWISSALMVLLIIYFYSQGYFQNPEALQSLLASAGLVAPVLFILIQIIQVVIPIIPGGISCAIGTLAFGPFWGFIYNYAGICIGSIIIFLLARKYGKAFILRFTDEAKYDKYAGWLDKGNKFDLFFTAAIFLPVAPDDLLCMIAGLTKMSLNKFTWIILLGKPLALLAYSFSLTGLLSLLG